MKLASLILVIISFGANTIVAQNNVTVSPNPFEDEITLTTTAQCGDSILFEVYNMSGQVILHHKEKIAFHPVTFVYRENLPVGVYLIRIATDTTSTHAKVIRSNERGPANIKLAFTEINCSDQPFEIFPNPSPDGIFKIRQVNIDRSYQVEIFDISGKRIWFETVQGRSDEQHLIDLKAYPRGSYSLRIKSSGEEFSSLIILE